MKIDFVYDIGKDVENFITTLKSVNNKEHTSFHKLYIEKYGQNFKPNLIEDFIKKYTTNLDISFILVDIESSWQSIHDRFIERTEKIFGIKYPYEKVTAYLTTNERCSYNTKENYFFVYIQSQHPNRTIMHELFHFYTSHVFYEEMMEKGITKEKYNDIKESLTVLLNVEFSDLLNGAVDYGYPQHQEMRAKIRDIWIFDKNIKKIIAELT